MQQVVDNQIRMDPKAQERMANATPEQRAMGNKISVGITEGVFIGGPVVGMVGVAVIALGLMGTINFGFGGKAKYRQIFAVSYYAWLPMSLKALLGTIVIYAGMAPESFNIKNFAPTNLGAFLDPVETNKALYTLATSLDAVTIWTLVLMGIGVAMVAGDEAQLGLHCGVRLVGAVCVDWRGLGGGDGVEGGYQLSAASFFVVSEGRGFPP